MAVNDFVQAYNHTITERTLHEDVYAHIATINFVFVLLNSKTLKIFTSYCINVNRCQVN